MFPDRKNYSSPEEHVNDLSKGLATKVSEDRIAFLLIATSLLFCTYNIFLGYGNDLDTYGMLRTWQIMLLDGHYVPSRFSGNIVPEFLLGAAASIGGPVASNLLVLGTSILVIVLVVLLLRRTGTAVGGTWLVVAVIATNPFWLIASSTSMDYMPAMAAFALGLWCLVAERRTLAVVLFAIAAGSRISYGPLGALVLLGHALWVSNNERGPEISPRRLINIGISVLLPYVLICGLFYLPAHIHHQLTFEWLTGQSAARPTHQGLSGLLARFLYKNVMLLGVWGCIAIILGLVLDLRGSFAAGRLPQLGSRPVRAALLLCSLVILYQSALFLYHPAEISYQLTILPALAAVLWLIGARRTMLAVALAQTLYSVISINPLRIEHAYTGLCSPLEAVDARLAPHFEWGVLVKDHLAGPALVANCLLPLLRVQPPSLLAPLPPAHSWLDPAGSRDVGGLWRKGQ